MRLHLHRTALGNSKIMRDLSLPKVVRLMSWQTRSMLGLLNRSRMVSIGRRVVLLGSSISKNLKLLTVNLTLWSRELVAKDEKVIKSLALLDFELSVSIPIGDTSMTNLVLKSCIICIEGRELLVDLVLLDMHDFDVILGMDWLASYHTSVHCFEKEVVFRPLGELEFLFKASCLPFMPRVISCIQANRLLRKGCQGFLASVVDLQSRELEIRDIPIVREFLDDFPKDLLGLPQIMRSISLLISFLVLHLFLRHHIGWHP